MSKAHDLTRAKLRAIPDNGQASGLRITAAGELYAVWGPGAFEVLWHGGTPCVKERAGEPPMGGGLTAAGGAKS